MHQGDRYKGQQGEYRPSPPQIEKTMGGIDGEEQGDKTRATERNFPVVLFVQADGQPMRRVQHSPDDPQRDTHQFDDQVCGAVQVVERSLGGR